MKNIILVSNPFGWGPTGKLDSIIDSLRQITSSKETNLIFAGGKYCQSIINHKNCQLISVDERSVMELEKLISSQENPYVFGAQNRFAIMAAKKLKVPCAFLDGLAWFWDKIPDSHFLADKIFWTNFIDLEDKLKKYKSSSKSSIKLVSGIGTSRDSMAKIKLKRNLAKSYSLVNLGGGENPLNFDIPRIWLKIIALSLKEIKDRKILVSGSEKMIKNLIKFKLPTNIICQSLTHSQFIKALKRADRLVTPGGQMATTEAMSLGVPVCFLPSYNLSQAIFQIKARQEFAAPLRCDWQDIGLEVPRVDEKKAIIIYDKYAKLVLERNWWQQEIVYNIKNLFILTSNFSGQQKFIRRIGTNGAEEIAKELKKIWALK